MSTYRSRYLNTSKKELADLIESGLTQTQIGEKIGCARASVSKLMKIHGLSGRRRVSNIPKEELMELIDCDSSIIQIAKEIGCTNNTLHVALKKHGLVKKKVGIDLDKLRELVNDGYSIKEIADSLCCSKESVYRLIEKLNLDFKFSPKSKFNITKEKLFEIYVKQWKNRQETANYFGCSTANISRLCSRFNIKKLEHLEFERKKDVWNKGLTKETHPSIAAGAKKKQGELNPLFGKTPWNKDKTKATDERLKIVSDKKTGVALSDSHKQKLSEAKTGLRMEDANNWRGGVHAPYPQRLDDKGHRKYTHRLIAGKILGESAIKDKEVHHINGNKQDPTPQNLLVISSKAHTLLHKHFGFSTINAPKDEQLKWLTDNGFSYLYVGENL